MEYVTEIINIAKIKEGFYIGDRFAGTNLEVIMHFKITHIINAAGTQIMNHFDTIGVKYLALNWSENLNQKLFNVNDEVVDRIINFIDDSLTNGEGLLVHSFKGQNRVCVVVIIYLIKKYRWGLMKCIDFLNSKKQDINIPKPYLSQLGQFEMRLMKTCQGTYSHDWNNCEITDNEEILLRNTYVNGLPYKSQKKSNHQTNKKKGKPKIGWGDFNPYNSKDTLVHPNPVKDLIQQKEIKPVMAHIKLRPSKSCVKKRTSPLDVDKNDEQKNNDQFKNDKQENNGQLRNNDDERKNNDQLRNNDDERKNDGLKGNEANTYNIAGLLNQSSQPDEILKKRPDILGLSPLCNNILNSQTAQTVNIISANSNNNITNEFDNNPESSSLRENKNNQNQMIYPIKADIQDSQRTNNFKINKGNNPKKGNDNFGNYKRPSTVDRNTNNSNRTNHIRDHFNMNEGNFKGYIVRNSNPSGQQLSNKKKNNEHYNIESKQKPINNLVSNNIRNISNELNIGKIKSPENQRIILNNYVKDYSMKKNNSNDAIVPLQNQQIPITKEPGPNIPNNDTKINNYPNQILPFRGVGDNNNHNYIIAYNKPLNNFDPSLMKKNQKIFTRTSNSSGKGPIKLSNDLIIQKPLTPDQMLYINGMKPNFRNRGFNKSNYNEIYGNLIKKTGNIYNNNNDNNFIRPATAPQKDKQKKKKNNQKYKISNEIPNFSTSIYNNPQYPGMKRLPSPMVKSNNMFNSQNWGSGYLKASPLILKSNVLNIDSYQQIPILK